MTYSRNLYLTACGTSLAAMLAAAPASAQDAAPANGEIVVTAQHKSENIQNVPISINAFSKDNLEKLGVHSTADLGLVTPNVNISLSQGAGSQPTITIRGIGINDENTNNAGPIAVYVDDVYMSAPGSQNFATFDLQRVEVLKGPQGTLYGRNSSGGAINFVSEKPSEVLGGYFHLAYSSYNTVNVEGAVGGPIADTLSGRISFVKNYSAGYTHNYYNGISENGANDYGLRGQLLYKPTDRLKILLGATGAQVRTRAAQYGHFGVFVPGTQDNASPAICSVADTYANKCVDLAGYTQPSYHDGSYNKGGKLKVDNLMTSLRVDYDAGPFDLTSISSYQYNKRFVPEETDSSPNRLLEINWGVKSHAVTQELRASHSGGRLDWTGGLYFLHEGLRQDQPLDLLLDFDNLFGPGSGDGIANRQTDRSHQVTDAYAAFGQAEYKVTDRLKLIAGGRITYEHRTFSYQGTVAYQEGGEGNFGTPISLLPAGTVIPPLKNTNFSWRLGANYKLSHDVLLYTSVTTGFKSGDFNGGFLSTDPLQAVAQIQPIKPEKDTAYEVGLKSSFADNKLIFNAAFFYTDYRDLQTFALIPSASGPLNSLTSAKKAHNIGADIELTAKPFAGLTLSTQLGLLNAKIDDFKVLVPGTPSLKGLQLAYSPHVSAFLSADYRFAAGPGNFDLNFTASYKSHQFYDSGNDPYDSQKAYWIENVRVGYQVGKWEVAGFVRNLSDKKYSQYTFDAISPFGFVQTMPGLPRFYGLELNYKF